MLSMLVCSVCVWAQTQLSTDDLSTLYTSESALWVSVHDPSVVFNDGEYYIWGSHLGAATSSDLISYTSVPVGSNTFYCLAAQGDATGTPCTFRTAFNTQQVTEVVNYLGETVAMPNIDAAAYCSRYADDKTTWVDGVMWAPDIIWNESLQKWCMYLSLDGDYWSSIIILLTSDSPTEGFTYQAPIVMSGFDGQIYNGISAPDIAETDLAIATGDTTIPDRYLQSDNGTYWPNCIDPCVFYDEDGELWMSYGSWSGGIFILKLDKTTGLRDYTYTYDSDYDTSKASGTTDPYYGKKIAGGYYVSGEGSYIQHIGDYYYLFMSYGGYAPDGGYEMRIFRSESPDGPYTDGSRHNATYTSWQLNYGPGAATDKGMLLMSSYNGWGGVQTLGERAQGHNSACADDQGRNFVVYHTKFNDGTAGHQVRAHQLFTNDRGWLVAAPFVYQGETLTDEVIATTQLWDIDALVGDYYLLQHAYELDHNNYAEVTPITITLNSDGTITGDKTGTWSLTDGTSYITISLGSTRYYGVLCEQSISGTQINEQPINTSLKAIAFTATASSGTPIWGYKLESDYAIAWNYAQGNISLTDGQVVDGDIHMMFDTDNNTTLTWTSSEPDIISETGKYSPVDEDTAVTLSARLTCGDFYWTQDYTVTAAKDVAADGDYLSGLVAYYNFDELPTYNQYKSAAADEYDEVTYGAFGGATTPELVSDYDRYGQVAHIFFGANSYNSYCQMVNPLYLADIDGLTVAAWIKRTDSNGWDALWTFCNFIAEPGSGPRLYLTGNTYLGYNDDAGTWYDLNYPTIVYDDIPVGAWAHVITTIGQDNQVTIYVDGIAQAMHSISASDGATALSALPISATVSDVTEAQYFFLGNGSWWGSPDFYVDDLMIYNRELSAEDAAALSAMCRRDTDFTVGENGTGITTVGNDVRSNSTAIYDLSGRRITTPTAHGVYIQNGKKYVK